MQGVGILGDSREQLLGLLGRHALPRGRHLAGLLLAFAFVRLALTIALILVLLVLALVLACAWPILIGIATLAGLEYRNPLAPEDRLKISRRAVRSIVFRSVLTYPFRALWAGQIERLGRRENVCDSKSPS